MQPLGIAVGSGGRGTGGGLPFRNERHDHLDTTTFEQVERVGDSRGFGRAIRQFRIARAAQPAARERPRR